ncbi:MAG: hypothetical protein V1735_03255 [Nanoarchaeota archaeon]
MTQPGTKATQSLIDHVRRVPASGVVGVIITATLSTPLPEPMPAVDPETDLPQIGSARDWEKKVIDELVAPLYASCQGTTVKYDGTRAVIIQASFPDHVMTGVIRMIDSSERYSGIDLDPTA